MYVSFIPVSAEMSTNFSYRYCFVNNPSSVKGNINGVGNHWKPSTRGRKYFFAVIVGLLNVLLCLKEQNHLM